MNDLLPYKKQWFPDGFNNVDYCTTDKCVKNEENQYRPAWFSDGSNIRDKIATFVAERIPEQKAAQPVESNNEQDVFDDSFDDDLGPNFGSMQLPNANDLVSANSSQENALTAIRK